MLKVLRAVGDEFEIEELETGDTDVVSAEMLVLLLAKNEFEGCKHSRNGIEVRYNGVEPYEIAVEVWKPISIYNCKTEAGVWKYWVSNLGRLASSSYIDTRNHSREAHILSGSIMTYGYRVVILRVNNIPKTFRVCRIVATEFVFNKSNHPIVNHKNECKSEDWCGNLEWCTYAYNITYNDLHLRKVESMKRRVRQYSLSGKFLKEFESLSAAKESLGISGVGGISKCCRRDKDYSYAVGFIWRYSDDDELYTLSEEDRRLLVDCRCKYVRQYNLNGEFIGEYSSMSSAERSSGVNVTHISNVCRRVGNHRTAGGFLWRHPDDDEFADRPENVKAIAEWRQSHNV